MVNKGTNMDRRLIAAQCLSVAARRLCQLYSGSETDEGHLWGEEGQPKRHADAVIEAVEAFQEAMGQELGEVVLAAETETELRRLRTYLEKIETADHLDRASCLATAALAPKNLREQIGIR